MDIDQLRDLLLEYDTVVQRTLHFNRHAVHPDDLLADLWLVWTELSEQPGPPLQLTRHVDRELVIEAWRRHTEAAGRRERLRRGGALSLDQASGFEPDAPALIERLAAHEQSDPEVALAALEDALDDVLARLLSRAGIEQSWSQPAGYLILLEQHAGGVHALAAACGIADHSLFLRVARLMLVHHVQSRLFDGRHRLVGSDVRVPRGRPKIEARSIGASPQPALWADH